jgi:hypothetical protein
MAHITTNILRVRSVLERITMPHYLQIEVDAQLLKMLRRKSKAQFVKQERNTQNSIVLLKYLKRIAPQQLMLRMQVFTKIFLKRKERKRDFLNKKVGFQMIMICRI